MELVKRNDLDLHITFGGALTEAITILTISEFENVIQIDSNNSVFKDYM